MTAPIDFWFDFGSPYAYLAAERLPALCAAHGRVLRWRPVLVFAVLRQLQMPAVMAHVARLDYLRIDIERSARFLGLPYRHPSRFPVLAALPARLFYTLASRDADAAAAFAAELLRRAFRDDVPSDDRVAVGALAAHFDGRTADELRRLAEAEPARAALAQAIDAAAAQRVFGSPFVVVDGEPFFGADRLPQIAARLALETR